MNIHKLIKESKQTFVKKRKLIAKHFKKSPILRLAPAVFCASLIIFSMAYVVYSQSGTTIGINIATNDLLVNGNATTTGNQVVSGNLVLNGKVGIGTTTPTYKLEVNDTSLFSKVADGITYTAKLMDASGTSLYGLVLERSAIGYPIGISLKSTGTTAWETAALDYDTRELVLAYDPTIPGDVLRLSPGGNMIFGAGIGSPAIANHLLTIQGTTDRGNLRMTAGQATYPTLEVDQVLSVGDAIKIVKGGDAARGFLRFSQGTGLYDWRVGMLGNPYNLTIYNASGTSSTPAAPGMAYVTFHTNGSVSIGSTNLTDYTVGNENLTAKAVIESNVANIGIAKNPTLVLRNTNTTAGNSNTLGFATTDGANRALGAFISALYKERVSGCYTATDLIFGTGATYSAPSEKMRITSSGKVGIGTTTPSTSLQVANGTATTTITIGSAGSGKGGCLKIRDSNDAGWTYCSVLGGVMTCGTTSCE